MNKNFIAYCIYEAFYWLIWLGFIFGIIVISGEYWSLWLLIVTVFCDTTYKEKPVINNASYRKVLKVLEEDVDFKVVKESHVAGNLIDDYFYVKIQDSHSADNVTVELTEDEYNTFKEVFEDE